MKKFFAFIIFLAVSTICGFVICISLFHTPLFSNITVLMYRGIALIIVTAIILAIILSIIRHLLMKNRIKSGKNGEVFFDAKDIFTAVIVFMCIKMMFFTLVPVTVERSVSVFTLSQMANLDENIFTKEDAEDIFIETYVDKNDAFGKRFDEQIVTGSMVDNGDGTYSLTKRGYMLVDFFKFIGRLYNADMKNMINE